MSKALALKSLFQGLSKFFKATEILNSRTVLKIRCKSSLMYFGMKNIMRVDFGLEKPIEGLQSGLKRGLEKWKVLLA